MRRITIALAIVLSSAALAGDADRLPDTRANAARIRWERDRAKEVEAHKIRLLKVDADYMLELDNAIQRATKAGKLDAAIALRDERETIAKGEKDAKSASPESLRKKLEGTTWRQREFPSKMTLRGDWLLDSHTNGNPRVRGNGTWAIIDDDRIRLGFPGIKSGVFTYDGKTMKGPGMTWDRID